MFALQEGVPRFQGESDDNRGKEKDGGAGTQLSEGHNKGDPEQKRQHKEFLQALWQDKKQHDDLSSEECDAVQPVLYMGRQFTQADGQGEKRERQNDLVKELYRKVSERYENGWKTYRYGFLPGSEIQRYDDGIVYHSGKEPFGKEDTSLTSALYV